MDRNTVIATVLIGLIMIVWLYFLAPQPVPPDAELATGADTVQTFEPAPEVAPPPPPVPDRSDDLTDLAATDASLDLISDAEAEFVRVENDLYVARFSSFGGTLVSFELKEYRKAESEDAVQIVDTTGRGAIGLILTTPSRRTLDTRNVVFMTDDGPSISADLQPAVLTYRAEMGDGALVKKYHFKPESYEVRLEVDFENAGSFMTNQGFELIWSGGVPFTEGDQQRENDRTGAYARSGGETEEITLRKEDAETKVLSGAVDWVAVKNTYFTAAIIPSDETRGGQLSGRKEAIPGAAPDSDIAKEHYEVSLEMVASEGTQQFRLYLGPMQFFRLRDYDLGLYSMVDYGINFFEWMTRPLAKFVFIPLFNLLAKFIPNYGIVIIILSVIMKIVLYPLTKSSFKSMARMRDLQPKMEAIKEKHSENPQKQQEAMMKMYKEAGVNPLGGCMPMLLQYPVIIALWQFLPQSIEIRQQGFLWAKDLSAPDVILNLPFDVPLYGNFVAGFTVLMGLSMVVQMRMQATPTSNAQAKMIQYLMPVMIFVIFNRFASGLSLYYLCYNILTALQQKLINRSMHKEKEESEGSDAPSKPSAGKKTKLLTNGSPARKKKSKKVRS